MKPNFERLEKLIVALKGAKKAEFSMDKYGHTCGTPACVLGHYASRHDLQRSFKLVVPEGFPFADILPFKAVPHPKELSVLEFNDDVVCRHFGITVNEADELFSHMGCDQAKTAGQARRYIRKFINRKKKEVK